MNTKNSGNRPCTASPEPVRRAPKQPSAPNAERREAPEHDHHERPADAGVSLRAGDQPDQDVDERLQRAECLDADEQPGDQRHASQRRQREPVEEAALDVLGEVGAGVDQREHRRPG